MPAITPGWSGGDWEKHTQAMLPTGDSGCQHQSSCSQVQEGAVPNGPVGVSHSEGPGRNAQQGSMHPDEHEMDKFLELHNHPELDKEMEGRS